MKRFNREMENNKLEIWWNREELTKAFQTQPNKELNKNLRYDFKNHFPLKLGENNRNIVVIMFISSMVYGYKLQEKNRNLNWNELAGLYYTRILFTFVLLRNLANILRKFTNVINLKCNLLESHVKVKFLRKYAS